MKTGSVEAGEQASEDATPKRGKKLNRGILILDLVLRVFGAICTLGSAVAMGTTSQTLPSSSQFFRFRAKYNDLPMFMFFVIANSIVCAYLVLSLRLSIFHIIRSAGIITRIILVTFDMVMLVLLTCGASAATSIDYLAHKGNASANWLPFCVRFSHFCNRISGSLIGSFFSIIIFMLLVILSAVSQFSICN
ncbi:casparian strip membrane protein 4 [Ricinus communis]|uniref:casparian strip membrane protein 4 n=1 Tax=Ricinus communis TaxID=3988 RepID=UPI00201A4647|nr:casparian strip membrane protein 4 [Ricinus communis]XP_048226393.1 casparian strip membrane protein 4 [Ricinus communis]